MDPLAPESASRPAGPDEGEPVTLPGGERVLIRPLHASDREAYSESLAAMSSHSRYLRFAAPKPRFSAREIDFLTHPDGVRHVALVAVDPATRDGVGVARYVRRDDGTADVAVGVVDAWQHHGVGIALLERLVAHARAAGVTALTATALAENAASAAMLARTGFRTTALEGITNEYRLDLGS